MVVASGLVFLPFIAHRPGYRPLLAWGLLAAGTLYAVAVLRFGPYRRYFFPASSYGRAAVDAAFLITWLGATGGVDSPWDVTLLLGIATSSYRYNVRVTRAALVMYSGGYILMASAAGQLEARAADIAIFVVYMLLTAGATVIIIQGRSKKLDSRLRLLNTMQEIARVGSWEWSVETNALTWSNELRRIFALPEGVEPTLERFMQLIHPDDRDAFSKYIDRMLSERRALGVDHRIMLPDGTVRWLHCRGVLLFGDDGGPVSVIGSSQDITDQRQLEAKLLLSDRLASIGTMASGIAHEINNPLAYVATNLEVIDRQLKAHGSAIPIPLSERLREALDAARHGSDRVREIVRGLKTFARPEDQSLVNVQLSRVADFAARIVSLEIEPRARLVREYEPVGPVRAIEARLTQVFVNLLVNAAHAIERGKPDTNEILIRIGKTGGDRAFVEIRDTGSGISAANVERIFDPFFTTKPTGIGTGLGLSICKGIVTELKGEISVESKPGAGATFRVTLPVVAEPPSIEPRRSSSAMKVTTRKKRVLIVDDEDRYAKSLELLLNISYDVSLAKDGARALDYFSQGDRFDVILCDLMMPRMTGMDLYEALAERAPDQRARIVFLTGGATNDLARAFLARADVRYLEKPLELPKLEAAMEGVIADAEAAEEGSDLTAAT